LLKWAIAVLLLPVPLFGIGAGITAAFGVGGGGANDEPPPMLLEALATFSDGSYADIVRTNVLFAIAGGIRRLTSSMQTIRVLGMFLLGYWCGRVGLFARPRAHRRLFVRLIAAAVVVGLPASVGMALLPDGHVLLPTLDGWPQAAAATFGAPLLALGYAAAIALAYDYGHLDSLHWLAPVGRLALTNYLLQSLALFVIYYGTGFGLFGRVSLAAVLLISTLFFAIQVVLSRWWLRFFAYGPIEWLWRQFTYRRRMPIRRRHGVGAIEANRAVRK
jgi:uncharacterized protein